MGNLLILSNVERLPAWDNKNGNQGKAFGLNLSVAIDGAIDTSWLKTDAQHPANPGWAMFWPWRWTIPSVLVYFLDDSNSLVKDQEGNPLPPATVSLTTNPTDMSEVSAGLEKKFLQSLDQTGADQRAFTWGIDPKKGQNKERTFKLSPTSKPPWHTLLGKVSTYPFPVPQALKLSFIFYTQTDANVKRIFAAPVIAAGNPVLTGSSSPGVPGPNKAAPNYSSDPRFLQSDYDGSPQIPIRAYSAPCSLAVSAPGFIDPATQWVNDPGGDNASDDDWLSTLETRMADALDLSQVLVAFLNDATQSALLNQGNNLRLCTEMALAAMADITGPGLALPPDGTRLIDKLLKAASLDPLSTAEVTSLESVVLYPAVNAYRRTLRDLFNAQRSAAQAAKPAEDNASPVDDFTILRDDPPRITIQQAIAQLEGVRSRLLHSSADRNVLLAMARLQWTQLFQKLASPRPAQVDAMVKMADTSTAPDRSALNTDPRVRDLRRQMALSNLGRYWPELILAVAPGTDNGRELVSVAFPAFFQFYLVARFGLNVTVNANGVPKPAAKQFSPAWTDAVPSELASALLAFAQNTATDLAKNLMPTAPASTSGNGKVNETPHAITLQIEQLAPIPDETTELKDVLNRFSGVGFLMRELGTTDWYCLNRADLEVNSGAGTTTLPLSDPAVVPFRISYRNGLRQVCASYDNRPLIADSPLGHEDVTRWIAPQSPSFDALIRNRYSTNAKMPGLIFGKTYELAVFAIANCGAIPPELAQSNFCQLKASLVVPNAVALRQVPYKRRVRIGAPRLTDLNNPKLPMNVPLVPENVHPLARDLKSLSIGINPGGGAQDSADLSTHQMPLVLLSPAAWKPQGMPSMDASVRLPSTHWDCWQRWTKSSASASVIASFYRTAAANAKNSDPKNALDLTVDDPALEPRFYFELMECQPDGTLSNAASRWVPVARPLAGSTGLASQRSQAAPFTCSWTNDPTKVGIDKRDPVSGNPGVPEGAVITVLEGHVYRLGIYCAITRESAAKFTDGVLMTQPSDDANLLLVSPQFIAIEAATAALPCAADVWHALKPAIADLTNGNITVTFDGISRYLHRAELRRQVWRWQGRNTRIHPRLLTDTPDEAKLLEWEAVEFGDRPDADSVVVPMKPNAPALDGSRSFTYREVLKNAQGDSDLRSLHFRFAVTVFSRYEGLIPTAAARSVNGTRVLPGKENVVSSWTRLFVPCRRTDGGNAPRVRLVLPLTGAPSDDGASPGLLVVFDEPWHATGGLSERLQIRIALTADPGEAPDKLQHYYLEVGPDPIVSHTELSPQRIDLSLTTNAKPDSLDWPQPVGPVGHYFDTTNSAALFNCTSFMISAPRVNGVAADQPWTFAKLQFRRVLWKKLRQLPLAKNAPKDAAAPLEVVDMVASPFTDPVWAQYLPPFSIFDDTIFSPQHVRASFVDLNSKGTLVFTNVDGSNCRLQPLKFDNNNYFLYAVLTRRVFDVTGRADQEQFAGLFAQGTENWWTLAYPHSTPQAAPELGYRVRVIEVQQPFAVLQGSTLFDDLFEPKSGGDAGARIVRISQPIDFGATVLDTDTCGGN